MTRWLGLLAAATMVACQSGGNGDGDASDAVMADDPSAGTATTSTVVGAATTAPTDTTNASGPTTNGSPTAGPITGNMTADVTSPDAGAGGNSTDDDPAATDDTDDSTEKIRGDEPTPGDASDDTIPNDAEPSVDAGAVDAGANDACMPFEMPADCVIPENAVLPEELRCTGLYEDWASRTLYCGVMTYEPAYPLWSDGLDKPRYVWLPSGSQVDVTDPDAFVYPVGTQFWKEFRHPDGKLAETRLMRRLERGWIYTTYVWTDDESNAIQENFGVQDLHGSGHTVPTRDQCKECHSGRSDFILGWDAVMLGPGSTGLTRETLVESGLVNWDGRDADAPNPLTVDIPGDGVERAALGYLHANCGVSCHNDTSNALALETGFFTRLDAATLSGTVQQTNAFATGLNRRPSPNAPLSDLPPAPDGTSYVDLRPLDTEQSLILLRMERRNEDAAMPRVGTNVVDEVGVSAVRAWIESMTEERGYPASAE